MGKMVDPPAEVHLIHTGFLEDAHTVEVVHLSSRGLMSAAEVGTLVKEDVIDLAVTGSHTDADALLIPDTALHSAAWLSDLEQATGKPVLTANQVSFWEALRLCGKLTPQPGLGKLFAEVP